MEVAKFRTGQKYVLVRQNGKEHRSNKVFNIKRKLTLSLDNSRHEDQLIRHYCSYLIEQSAVVVESGMTNFHSCGKQKKWKDNFELNIASFLVSINLDQMLLKDAYKAFENPNKSVVPLDINGTRNSAFSCNDLFSYLQNCKEGGSSQKVKKINPKMELVFPLTFIGLLIVVVTSIYCTSNKYA
jgi:hypothetical protein